MATKITGELRGVEGVNGIWDELPLGQAPLQIIDGDRGKSYPKHGDFANDGYCLFLNATNVTKFGFDFSQCQFISEQKDEELRKGRLNRNDIVLTTRGTLGNSALYGDGVPYEHIRINSGMVIMRTDATKLIASFLYGFLRSPSFERQVEQLRSGVAQPQLPIRDITKIKLPLPARVVQQRVVEVFSAYDNLIENNRRRMALLEDAARHLYREWFVRLRFPGYEHTRMSNGLPDGWARQPIAAVCESIDYGYTASAQNNEVGPKFLRITDIVPDVIDWNSVPYCQIEEDRLEKFCLREGDIVVARTGATVGYAKRIHKRHPEAVFASYLVRLRPQQKSIGMIVGLFVESKEYKSYVQSRVGGAAQPNANAKVLSAAEIIVPSLNIQKTFNEYVEPLLDQREIFQLENQKLRTARDLLLPRLMTGEIRV